MKNITSLLILFFSCLSATAQSTVAVDGKWIPEGFSNVLYILEDGKIYTYYCVGTQNCDSLYNTYEAADGNHIPGVDDFTFDNDTISIDLNFGNYLISHLIFECDSNILNFSSNNTSWIRLGTNLNDCVSASTEESLHTLKVFPNPATDFITIESIEGIAFQLTDISGKVLLSGTTQLQNPIDISNLHTGIYHIRFEKNGTVRAIKVLKM